MSEYIEIEAESTSDPNVMRLETNLTLSDEGSEVYEGAEEMEEGSPLAQALAVIPGIARLEITGSDMIVTSDGETPWHIIIVDVSAAVKDFFL